MKWKQSQSNSGGAMLWIFIVLAILVGAYLAFGVMGIHRIRGKIDEAMGKKPVTAARGDEGALMIHQEQLRQQDEAREQAAAAVMEIQAKIDAQNKSVRREVMRVESGEER